MEYFNNLQNASDKVLVYDDGSDEGGEFSNIKKARILTPKKNICAKCNSERSADCDNTFDAFVIEAFHFQENIPEIKTMVSPSLEEIIEESQHQWGNIDKSIAKTKWSDYAVIVWSKYWLTTKYLLVNRRYDDKLIKKYLAKHSICYFARLGISAPAKLREVFLNGQNLDALDFKIYILPLDFQHGYMNTMIKTSENDIWYALIFSNLAIHVTVKM